MTTECNLACSYCYLKNSRQGVQTIDLDFAKRGMLDYFSRSPSRHIRFFAAGEPTLEIDKIRTICEFATSLAEDSLKSEIQTNGFFPPQTATWLAENMDIIWLSWDGPPRVHDLMRRTYDGHPTSHILERNAQILANGSRPIVVGARATITPANLYRQSEMLEYFKHFGIKAVFSDPVFPAVEGLAHRVTKLELGQNFMMTYAQEYLKAREQAQKLGIFYGSILSVNFDEETESFCRSCLPSPHLTPDGYVTACDMASAGNVLNGLAYGKCDPMSGTIIYDDRKLARIQLRRAPNLAQCHGCSVLLHCAGGCFGEGFNETGDLLGVKTDYCDAIRFLAEHLPLNEGLYPYLHP
jgi:radical SAM protein with 4Fe4S-binding SPASM domain